MLAERMINIAPQFDKVSSENYFDHTRNITLKTSPLSIEWDTLVPENNSQGYVTLGKRGQYKFEDKGRELAFQIWSTILAAGGDNASPEDIKKISKALLQNLKNKDWSQKEYIQVLEKSLRMRTRHFERYHLQTNNQTNSTTLDEVKTSPKESVKLTPRIHPRFVQNKAGIGILLALGGSAILARDNNVDSVNIHKQLILQDKARAEETMAPISKQDQISEVNKSNLSISTYLAIMENNHNIKDFPATNHIIYESKSSPSDTFSVQGINFSEENKLINITLKINNPDTNNSEPLIINSIFVPVPYYDNLTTKESLDYLERTSPGTGKFGVDVEKYGNFVVYGHSGYKPEGSVNVPLEFEAFRSYFEAGDSNKPWIQLSEKDTENNLNNIEKSSIEIEQGGVKIVSENIIAARIPHEYSSQLFGDTNNILDTVISATGGENSKFNYFKDHQGIFLEFCGWGETTEPNWWQDDTYIIAVALPNQTEPPSNDKTIDAIQTSKPDTSTKTAITTRAGGSITPNMKSTIRENSPQVATNETETSLSTTAEVLTSLINNSYDTNTNHGAALAHNLSTGFNTAGIEINDRLATLLNMTKSETSDNNLQCFRGVTLLASMQSKDSIPNIGGWQIYDPFSLYTDHIRPVSNADELLKTEVGKYDEHLLKGNVINKSDTVVLKTEDISDFEEGDIFVVAKNYVQKEGHLGVVLDKWIDEYGEIHIKIFDVNFFGDGRARIIEVTNKNTSSLLAGLPEASKAQIFAIRSALIQQHLVASRETQP